MPSGTHIDDNLVHEYLWKRSDRRGVVRIEPSALMKYLGVNKYTVSRLVARMVEDGRMEQVTKRRYRVGLFRMVDPEEYVSESETK